MCYLFVYYLVKGCVIKINFRNGFLALILVVKDIFMRFLDPLNFLIWLPVTILDFTLYREFSKFHRGAGELIL